MVRVVSPGCAVGWAGAAGGPLGTTSTVTGGEVPKPHIRFGDGGERVFAAVGQPGDGAGEQGADGPAVVLAAGGGAAVFGEGVVPDLVVAVDERPGPGEGDGAVGRVATMSRMGPGPWRVPSTVRLTGGRQPWPAAVGGLGGDCIRFLHAGKAGDEAGSCGSCSGRCRCRWCRRRRWPRRCSSERRSRRRRRGSPSWRECRSRRRRPAARGSGRAGDRPDELQRK